MHAFRATLCEYDIAKNQMKKNCGGGRRTEENIKGVTEYECQTRQSHNDLHSNGLSVTPHPRHLQESNITSSQKLNSHTPTLIISGKL